MEVMSEERTTRTFVVVLQIGVARFSRRPISVARGNRPHVATYGDRLLTGRMPLGLTEPRYRKYEDERRKRGSERHTPTRSVMRTVDVKV
jgi:hypothetical protein